MGYDTVRGRERTHAKKDEEELLFCLTSTQASCDLQNAAEGKQSLSHIKCWCWCVAVLVCLQC